VEGEAQRQWRVALQQAAQQRNGDAGVGAWDGEAVHKGVAAVAAKLTEHELARKFIHSKLLLPLWSHISQG
jgi:hypothetical protein